ncbi:MAG TPA: hydrogenase maturation protease [Steroidobacteraceae bacterium]|nr:hydrogenase maturation protease [Steroidobacteraceae bacterium]
MAHVEVIECHGDVLALLDRWSGSDTVVLIDAAAAVGTPGSIHRIESVAGELPAGLGLLSTHSVGVGEALALASALGRLPARVIVYAVEAGCLEPGELAIRVTTDTRG